MESNWRGSGRFRGAEVLAAACVVWLVGCSGSDGAGDGPGLLMPAAACLPGHAQACTCAGGGAGARVCDTAGSAFGGCDCGAGPEAQAPNVVPNPVPQTPVTLPPAAGATADPGAAGEAAPPPPPRSLARDVRIRELAVYQAVKVPLMREGQQVIARNAPVIEGKRTLMRVFVEALPGFVARELTAELTLWSSSETVQSQTLTATARVAASSTDAELDSTLNLDIEGVMITDDLRYQVSLREVDDAETAGVVDPGARWPVADGELEALSPRSAGPLRVMLVPFRYNGDGSGRLPTMDDAEIDNYRDTLAAFYPASEILITLHEPVDYGGVVGPNAGWSTLLDTLCALRTDEAPDPKVLYYGTIAPTDGWRSYGGGVVGISVVPGPAGNYGRCSVGIGFPGSADTMAHELGHAMGLPHAPCGTSGGPFPYAEASIGSWGFGQVSRTLKDPNEFKDLMSYCSPTFISDFNFQRSFERIRYLNLQFSVRPGPAVQYAQLLVDGADARYRRELSFALPPGGREEAATVTLLDVDGVRLGEVEAFRFETSEDAVQSWLVPRVLAGAASVVLDDGRVVRLH